MQLSTLSVGLGLFIATPPLVGLLKPVVFTQNARKFPRSLRTGYLLMAIGTLWFLYNLNAETISDFAAYKKWMLIGFGAVGILTCVYVQDFLAVRGLSVVLLLLAKLMLDTARWHTSPWRIVIATLAYVWILSAMWFIISPWRLRDLIHWITANHSRLRLLSALRLALGLLLLALGLTVF